MKLASRRFAPACIAVALMMLLAPWASAQVLQSVPSDALVVIKFNKLKATSAKIGAMANKLGLAQFQPDFADPLGSLKTNLNMTNGLDENGEAAMVIANTTMHGNEPPIVMLLPVTDYKAFMANYPDGKTTGDVTTFNFGGSPSYAANWGKYAAISPRQDVLAKKPATGGLTVAGLAAKELAEKDITAYVNMKVAKTKMLPEITKARAEILRDFERDYRRAMGGAQSRRPAVPGAAPAQPAAPAAGAPDAVKFTPVVKALISRLFDVVEQVVQDADAATYGITITDDGIKTTTIAEFAASSPSGMEIAKSTSTDKSLTAGLPSGKYLVYGGSEGDGKNGAKLIAKFAEPIKKELSALGAEGKALQTYLDSMEKLTAASSSTAFAMFAPSGALGQEAIIQFASVSKGDAKTIIAAQKDMLSSQQAFMEMFQPPQMRGMMKTSYQDNAKTVDGVPLGVIKVEFPPPAAGQPQSPQAMQMRQMMSWMYGPTGMNTYVGAIGADKVISAAGVKDAKLQELIAAAKASQDPITAMAPVQAVNAQLPKKRALVAYIAVDQIASTIANYAKMFGMPINFQLPANLPPIGVTCGNEGSALRVDGYVPAQLVQSVIAAGIQTYMQMQGGQQPGGPGGL